jgi:hypothetical protein
MKEIPLGWFIVMDICGVVGLILLFIWYFGPRSWSRVRRYLLIPGLILMIIWIVIFIAVDPMF